MQQDWSSVEPDARALLRAARGFLCLFWAVPLYLVLLLRGPALRIVILQHLALPPLLIAGLVCLAGATALRRSGRFTTEWPRGILNLTWASLAAIYFSFPADWWLKTQSNDYLFLNFLLLILCLLWLMQAADFLAGELARRFGRRALSWEAEAAEWAVIVFQLLPYLVLFTLAVADTLRLHLPLAVKLRKLVLDLPWWGRALMLIPCATTMSVCWHARSLCLSRLTLSANPAEMQPPPAAES